MAYPLCVLLVNGTNVEYLNAGQGILCPLRITCVRQHDHKYDSAFIANQNIFYQIRGALCTCCTTSLQTNELSDIIYIYLVAAAPGVKIPKTWCTLAHVGVYVCVRVRVRVRVRACACVCANLFGRQSLRASQVYQFFVSFFYIGLDIIGTQLDPAYHTV